MRLPLVIALAISVLLTPVIPARPASAAPCDDAIALRSELERESRRVDHWVLAWRIAYTALAVGQFAVAASGAADHDQTRSLVVGGAESAIGALGVWATPLTLHVPVPTGDACHDRVVLRDAAELAAFNEEQSFWVSHVGGLIINGAGTLVLAGMTSWRTGLISFATGYPIGLLANYTMPRASWGRVRERSWTATAGVEVDDHRYALVIRGAF
jgi:hypothetical protein